MVRHGSFVPGNLSDRSLEGRMVLSFFGSVGNWFTSEYNNVKQDLGITHKAHAKLTAAEVLQETALVKQAIPASSGSSSGGMFRIIKTK